jgi:hypothetical protein
MDALSTLETFRRFEAGDPQTGKSLDIEALVIFHDSIANTVTKEALVMRTPSYPLSNPPDQH